ncbi:MAG: hypothetical protein JWN76_3774 [Chitinophagaceae bacterium]|nr:hypothetical protein [Chitinophagaceae bacterium]
MKKLIIISFVYLFGACNSGTDKTNSQDTVSSQGPVENVNGNVPDTTNSLSPSDQGKDTTKGLDTSTKTVNKARP